MRLGVGNRIGVGTWRSNPRVIVRQAKAGRIAYVARCGIDAAEPSRLLDDPSAGDLLFQTPSAAAATVRAAADRGSRGDAGLP